jgi:hypothetical protein
VNFLDTSDGQERPALSRVGMAPGAGGGAQWQTTSRANEFERDAEVARDGAVRPATSSR